MDSYDTSPLYNRERDGIFSTNGWTRKNLQTENDKAERNEFLALETKPKKTIATASGKSIELHRAVEVDVDADVVRAEDATIVATVDVVLVTVALGLQQLVMRTGSASVAQRTGTIVAPNSKVWESDWSRKRTEVHHRNE